MGRLLWRGEREREQGSSPKHARKLEQQV